MKSFFLIYNAHLIDAKIDKKNGALLLANGKIQGFPEHSTLSALLKDDSVSKFDAKGYVVTPSFIDMHSHFRDPGFTYKEDIESGSSAALAGGFSTCVLMPNTDPVISSQKSAEANNKKGELLGKCRLIQAVSITKGFDGKTVSHIDTLDSKKVPIITEDGHEVLDSSVMLEAMKKASKKKIIVSCHCEDPFLAKKARIFREKAFAILAKEKVSAEEKKLAAKNLEEANSLLSCAEDAATYRNLRLAREASCHLHLCHVSTKASVEAVRLARKNGTSVTMEITPHHISLSGDTYPGVFQIVNPPLRSEKDRLALIRALIDGTADVIATDHAPHSESEKKNGSPGFSGLETAFSACYTELVKKHGMKLSRLSELMSFRPAELLGLKGEGLLQAGYKANITIIDVEKQRVIRGKDFKSKGKYTPLEGKKLYGVIKAVFFKGKPLFIF